jgi:4-amino-4-deoxy-L-arabinose transferase-like glycosyltransferase
MNNKLFQLLRQQWALFLLLGICVVLRFFIFTNYQPLLFNDSAGYKDLAVQLKTLNFSSYLGMRPPVYSLLILLSGINDYVVWIIQSCLGIAISILLYLLAMRLTANKALSFVVGLSYSLALQSLFFETMILTETLATFLLIWSLWLLVNAFDKKSIGLYILTGIGIGLAALTRPLLLFLIPLAGIFLFLKLKINGEATSEISRALGSLLIPAVILVGGWSLFNQIKVDYFGITTLLGYNLTNHSGAFMQYAPPEYSVIRDIYLKYRDNNTSQVNVIWQAYLEMQHATGLSFSELSRVLARMSLQMFMEHPGAYLKDVFKGWDDFWKPVFWYADYGLIRSVFLRNMVTNLSIIEMSLFSHLSSIFLLIAVWTMVKAILKPRVFDFNSLFVLIVLTASLSQALVEYGDGTRFAIPFLPLVLFEGITWLYYLFTNSLSSWRFEKHPSAVDEC